MRHIATMMLLTTSILVGCTVAKHEIVIDKPEVFHPSFPSPVKPRKVDFEVVYVDEKTMIRMNMDNYKKLSIYLEDILRYIKNINGVACHYRHDLNEDFCKER